jgi:hypothetical protein
MFAHLSVNRVKESPCRGRRTTRHWGRGSSLDPEGFLTLSRLLERKCLLSIYRFQMHRGHSHLFLSRSSGIRYSPPRHKSLLVRCLLLRQQTLLLRFFSFGPLIHFLSPLRRGSTSARAKLIRFLQSLCRNGGL